MVCNPFCCISIRRGAKHIAIIDILLFFLTAMLSVGLEWCLFHSIPMRLPPLFDDTSGEGQNFQETFMDNDDGYYHTGNNDQEDIGKAIWTHASLLIKSTSEHSMTLGYLMYMGMLVIVMSYFILEVWLCCVLIRATTEARPEFCNKWLACRSILLIMSLTLTGINVVQSQYTVTDVVVQPLNILRFYSIFVVIQLKKKLMMMGGAGEQPTTKLMF